MKVVDGEDLTYISGGAYKYADYITSTLGVKIHKEDEMHALITGLNFLLKNVPKESFTYSTVHNDPDPKHYVPIGVCLLLSPLFSSPSNLLFSPSLNTSLILLTG